MQGEGFPVHYRCLAGEPDELSANANWHARKEGHDRTHACRNLPKMPNHQKLLHPQGWSDMPLQLSSGTKPHKGTTYDMQSGSLRSRDIYPRAVYGGSGDMAHKATPLLLAGLYHQASIPSMVHHQPSEKRNEHSTCRIR